MILNFNEYCLVTPHRTIPVYIACMAVFTDTTVEVKGYLSGFSDGSEPLIRKWRYLKVLCIY